MTHTPDTKASEKAFLGAVINGAARLSDFDLAGDCFGDLTCRRVFDVCAQIEARGGTADLVTLFDAMPNANVDVLLEMANIAAVDAAIISQHAQNIRTAKQRREGIRVCTEAIQALQNDAQPLQETISKLLIALNHIDSRLTSEDHVSGTDCLLALYAKLFEEKPEPGISTGIARLDNCLNGGLKRGRLTIIGARPYIGKSSLINTIFETSIRNGKRPLLVTLEMPEDEATERALALATGIPMTRMDRHELSDQETLTVMEGFSLLPGERFVVSTKASTPSAIRRLALKMQANGGLDLICVDYLQILSADEKTSSRVETISAISRALKKIALELKIPVVAAAQCNRASANEDRPPRNSELREGSIENDADVIVMMHTPEAEMFKDIKPVQLIVSKNRQGGRLGKIDLVFDGSIMRYTEARGAS